MHLSSVSGNDPLEFSHQLAAFEGPPSLEVLQKFSFRLGSPVPDCDPDLLAGGCHRRAVCTPADCVPDGRHSRWDQCGAQQSLWLLSARSTLEASSLECIPALLAPFKLD